MILLTMPLRPDELLSCFIRLFEWKQDELTDRFYYTRKVKEKENLHIWTLYDGTMKVTDFGERLQESLILMCFNMY